MPQRPEASTLTVYPAAYMQVYALDSGARLVIINLSDTPMDSKAEILVRAKAGEAMSLVLQKVKEKIG
jgi:NAD-dependent deacetylase